MNIEGKTIILTGARRIGQTVAKTLAEHGVNLSIAYLTSKDETELLCEECRKMGVKAIPCKADLSKDVDVMRLITQTLDKFGRIDGLVHMASPYPKTPFATLTKDDFDQIYNAVTRSAFLLGKFVGDELLKNQGEDNIKGKIIFFSDWASNQRPYKNYLPYHTAKGAVETFTRALAIELAPHVTVNCIAPGPIWRPPDLSAEEDRGVMGQTPLGRWGGPDAIAKEVLYVLRDADFITGQILKVDGGRSIS